MPPSLSPAEIAQLQKEKARQQNFADAMTAAIPAKAARAAELGVADGAFKKFFDYYNDDIIGKYDSERRALNGAYIAAPITEADVQGPASLNGTWRTTPTSPVTDIVRITQFDGTPTLTDPLNETQHIADQLVVETTLVSGYGAIHFNPATCITDSALTSGSVTLKVKDPTNPITIVTNDIFVVAGGGDLAVVKVTTVTNDLGGDPPYKFTLGIQILVPPSGTIASASSMLAFTGFTNGERTTKTASNPQLQPLMNYLVAQLQARINNRKSRLVQELAALNTNQDPDGVSAIATAITNVNTSNAFLTAYLVSTDISNAGLASLATERATRGGQITARVAQIIAAYTGQTENYYNRRYTIANDRANTSRGTRRLQLATLETAAQLANYASNAQDAVDAIDALLP